MAEISGRMLDTPSGVEFVGDISDLVYVVGKHCGHEVSQYLEGVLDALDESHDAVKAKVASEQDTYEGTCELYHQIMMDAHDEISQLIHEMEETPRMRKSKISERLSMIADNLIKEL